MIQLRPYQEKAINEVREAYRTHKRILLVMPTGAGKSLTFSQICASAASKGKKVLCLSDRSEIFEQNIKAVSTHEIAVYRIDAKSKSSNIPEQAMLFFGMVETFKRRSDLFDKVKFDLIIVDEAHKNAYNKVFELYPDTKALGCTGTPVGKNLFKYYTHMVSSIEIPELIQLGYLSNCRGYESQDDFSDLQTDNSGEFTDQSNYKHFSNTKIYDGVIDGWLEKAKDKRTIVFCVNISHAEETAKAFTAAGIKAFAISSDTDETKRDYLLKEHRSGAFPVLVNANIFIAGYDDPNIECVVFNRATNSITVWLQGCGRGSRVTPTKKEFLVLDYGGNFTRHGLWAENRNWKLEPPKKKRNTLGAAPVKSCKACTAMLSMQTKECPYCGYIFLVTEAELKRGVLVELTNNIRTSIPGKYLSQCTIPELIELENVKQINAKHVWRIMRSRGAMAIGEYARIKKYRDEWILRQLESLEFELREGGVTFADKKINEIEFLTA